MNILDGLFGAGFGSLLGGNSFQHQQFAAQEQQRQAQAFGYAELMQERIFQQHRKSQYDDGDVIDVDCEETKQKQLGIG